MGYLKHESNENRRIGLRYFVVLLYILCAVFTPYSSVKEKEVTGTISKDESSIVFDQEKLRTYTLTVEEKDWQWLEENVIKEEYIPAVLDVDGKVVGKVGLRYKGSRFTLEGCVGMRGGERCSKISMKIKFNKYDKNLRYYGLKRLNFGSMMYDPSALRERLSYSIYREMNVITARAAHARLVINGKYKGLFSLVEQIDGAFIKKKFPEKRGGKLYKEVWPLTDNTTYYAKGLKTNLKNASHDEFVKFYGDLDNSEESKLSSVIAKWTDTGYLMRYMAVDRAICNWDGLTALYPLKTIEGFGGHNYYWYQEKDRPFFWLLPWDLDNTMTLKTGFDHVPEWDSDFDDCKKTFPIFGDETIAISPTCDRFIKGMALYGVVTK